MRETKFRFFYKNKRIEDALSLKEIGDRSSFHWADDVIVVQYIDRKDKNGKDCYWDDWVTDGINPAFLVTPDYHLLARLSEIDFWIVGNKYEGLLDFIL